MKILDAIERVGDACKNVTLSKEYDVTLKLNDGKNKPNVILRAAGNDSAKVVRLIASTVIVVGGAMISRALKSSD